MPLICKSCPPEGRSGEWERRRRARPPSSLWSWWCWHSGIWYYALLSWLILAWKYDTFLSPWKLTLLPHIYIFNWETWDLRSYLMQIVRAPSQGSLPPLEFLNIGSFDFKFQDQRCMWSLIIFLHSPLVDNGQTPSMSSHVFAIFPDLFFLYLKVCDWSSLVPGIKICIPKKQWEPVL